MRVDFMRLVCNSSFEICPLRIPPNGDVMRMYLSSGIYIYICQPVLPQSAFEGMEEEEEKEDKKEKAWFTCGRMGRCLIDEET